MEKKEQGRCRETNKVDGIWKRKVKADKEKQTRYRWNMKTKDKADVDKQGKWNMKRNNEVYEV